MGPSPWRDELLTRTRRVDIDGVEHTMTIRPRSVMGVAHTEVHTRVVVLATNVGGVLSRKKDLVVSPHHTTTQAV